MLLQARCYVTKNKNFLVAIPREMRKHNGPRYAYFSGEGKFLRPESGNDWEYAQSWGVPMETKSFNFPNDLSTHKGYTLIAGKMYVLQHNDQSHVHPHYSEVHPSDMDAIWHCVADQSLYWDEKTNTFHTQGWPDPDKFIQLQQKIWWGLPPADSSYGWYKQIAELIGPDFTNEPGLHDECADLGLASPRVR